MNTRPNFHQRHGEPLAELLLTLLLAASAVLLSACAGGLRREVRDLRADVLATKAAAFDTRQYARRLDSAWTRQSQERIDYKRNQNKNETDTAGIHTLRRMADGLLWPR